MKQVMRAVVGIFGAALGAVLIYLVFDFRLIQGWGTMQRMISYLVGAAVGFGLFFAMADRWARFIRNRVDALSRQIRKAPLSEIVLRTIGLIIGLLIAGIISNPVLQLSISRVGNVIGVLIAITIYAVLGLLGVRLASMYHDDIMKAVQQFRDNLTRRDEERTQRSNEKKRKKRLAKALEAEEDRDEEDDFFEGSPKILDTSVIIDGRIFEVMKAGFLEGPIIVSHYVLEELQYISDSSDALRRERGRKGLDRIHEMQTQARQDIHIDNTEIAKPKEVDLKLLVLTDRYRGRLVTNDFNLNKVATVQNIPVLNVNDLANALKPIVIPGEHMRVSIIKPGKEPGQGLGYLDDGTMIVVENGYDEIGNTVDTVVTSVLQTSAGKMIFTRLPE
ncbi:PIN domain-containing protein [uncultured Murdochiella sp.]|uniref:PIN/TRAM domain-containing protein n=1 Tax=uncultured Murdochiella sp. TaxID=1586095 RepID=UPI00280458EC|nr:TRAM domain-containing protein [uncultured Murdochiella sp.]